jgi:hypothetical protein
MLAHNRRAALSTEQVVHPMVSGLRSKFVARKCPLTFLYDNCVGRWINPLVALPEADAAIAHHHGREFGDSKSVLESP